MFFRKRFPKMLMASFLMCYYHISILWNGWIDRPTPEWIEDTVSEIMTNHSGTLNDLFPDENVLLVFDWDCLNR